MGTRTWVAIAALAFLGATAEAGERRLGERPETRRQNQRSQTDTDRGPSEDARRSSDQEAERKDEKTERHRAAIAALSAPGASNEDFVRATRFLREEFPDSRPVLHEAVKGGSPLAKATAIRLLGDAGEAERDLMVVVEATRDPDAGVRKASLVALRGFGPDGFEAVASLLRREPDARNRKVAIKTLQHWRDEAAVPVLVERLRVERDGSVRKFLVTALQRISKRNIGDNVDAWERVAQDWLEHDQAQRLLEQQRSAKER